MPSSPTSRRMVRLALRYGWVVVLVYYPPYHSKYKPIERLWGLLENSCAGSCWTARRRCKAMPRT